MKARNCLCSLFLFLVSCSMAFGQTITGSITGTVTDPSGAAVNDAKVTAINVNTGVQTPATTNADGIYTLHFLQIGHYKISVAAQGFSPASAGPFALEVSQEAKVDVHLTVGSVNESVVVSGVAPILNTQNATTGDTITAAAATELPLQARNFSSLTTLVAGAVAPNPSAQNMVGRSGYNGGFFINGNREQSNNYTLDGADINEAIDNYIGYARTLTLSANCRSSPATPPPSTATPTAARSSWSPKAGPTSSMAMLTGSSKTPISTPTAGPTNTRRIHLRSGPFPL